MTPTPDPDERVSAKVERVTTEHGIRYPDGTVTTGANISDNVIPGEKRVRRTRTEYADHVTEWQDER